MSFRILKFLKEVVMRWKKSILLALFLFTSFLFIYGCGSDNKSSGGLTSVPKVGDTKCVQCHSATADRITGEMIVAQYQRSAHYTENVGCEGCHGGGAQHNGVGPIPYPEPDQARCATCHNGTTAPATSSAKWANSNHAKPYEETTGDPCYRCHTSEGAILSNILGYTGDKDNVLLNNAYRPVLSVDRNSFKMEINCETCHEHGGKLRAVKATDPDTGKLVAWDPNQNRLTDEFDLCTSCHNLYNYNGTKLIASGKDFTIGTNTISSDKFYHETAWYRIIATTHMDQTATASGSGIEGYVIRKNAEHPCLECHGHDFKTNTRPDVDRPSTIYTDWAKSAHAGRIYEVKYAAYSSTSGGGKRTRNQDKVNYVMQAAVTDTTGAAWNHYDWDDKSRRDCQRCHTATGASNFLNDPANYNPVNNNFSHLAGWSRNATTDTVTSSAQNELLYCWGCHSNAGLGTLRNPGALTFTYSNNATVNYPDLSGSNVCMACHTGRETGDSIKNSFANFSSVGFINSHYLAAGGQLFGTTGYEYAGMNYANPSYFKHDKIGLTEATSVTKNGPCIGCHMTSNNKHLFTNVKKDDTGAITEITSKICAECHTGTYALTPAKLTEEEEDYNAAIEAAKAVLATKGIVFSPNYPYWYTTSNTPYRNWAALYGKANAKDVMGAAFNINLLAHDPGGYAHNRYYVKRLLWDSIDFVTDGTLGNLDMTATIDSLTGLTDAQKAAAKKYLGTTRP